MRESAESTGEGGLRFCGVAFKEIVDFMANHVTSVVDRDGMRFFDFKMD